MVRAGIGRLGASLLNIATGTAMLAMILVTFVDVVGRYGFHHSVFGASEMIEWLMVIVVFGGMARVTAADDHIRVSVLEPVLRRVAPVASVLGRHAFSLACYGLMTLSLWVLAIDAAVSGRMTAVLGWPTWIYAMSAAGLSLAGAIAFTLRLIATRGRLSPPADDPKGPAL